MKKEKIVPNCALCKWYEEILWTKPVCTAMGVQLTWSVYNTRKCKKLYEVKE